MVEKKTRANVEHMASNSREVGGVETEVFGARQSRFGDGAAASGKCRLPVTVTPCVMQYRRKPAAIATQCRKRDGN